METLGEKLKNAREQKACTFDQISRETNITRRYLEALESEDFSVFPGEAYLLGFLRNYGEYLGLNPQELVAMYRTVKIQEQPIPVEQLLRDPKTVSPRTIVVIAVSLVAALLVGGIVLFSLLSAPREEAREESVRKVVEYQLNQGILEKRLYIGDSVLVDLGQERFKISVAKLTEAVTLAVPAGDMILELGQEGSIDLTGDGNPDLKVFVADFIRSAPDKGVALRLEFAGETLGTAAAPAALAEGEAPAADFAAAAIPTIAASTASTPVLISSPTPYPFTLQATFRSYCLFRWEADRKEREERYFHKAEVLNVQAQNGTRIWVSNASAVKIVAIGGGKTVDVEIGGAGEVVVADVKWVKDEEGRFKLTIVRLE